MTAGAAAVVPNRDGAGLVGRCVEAALAGGAVEVVVVDDGSSDGSEREAAEAGARVLRSPGRGFAAAVNHGVAATRTPAVLLLNSDCFLDPEAVARLASALDDDGSLGAVGAALRDEHGAAARSHGYLLTLGVAIRVALSVPPPHPRSTGVGVQPVPFVPLACVLARRGAWDAIGGLDERYPFYFEDHDACRRLRDAGWRLAVRWDATAVHEGGSSSSARDPQRWFVQYAESRARYLRTHYPRAWVVWAAVSIPAALLRALAWRVRRGEGAAAWSRAWRRAAFAGLSG